MKNNLFKKTTAIFLSTAMLIPTQPIITFADGESVCEKSEDGVHHFEEGRVDPEATCQKTGTIYYSCEKCGFTKTDEIPKKKHTQYVAEEAVEATCTEAGYTALIKCSVCEEVLQEQEEIPAGHKEAVDKAVEPTCTEPGKTEGSHCEVCKAIIKPQEVIPATGHTEYIAEEEFKATCTESGHTALIKCSKCNAVLQEQEEIPPYNHKEVIIDEAIE